jgi:hypothetical protein
MTHDDWTTVQGQGWGTPLNPAIRRRIEEIGRLSDRREAAIKRGDVMELLRLADEYEAKRMPRAAAECCREAHKCDMLR